MMIAILTDVIAVTVTCISWWWGVDGGCSLRARERSFEDFVGTDCKTAKLPHQQIFNNFADIRVEHTVTQEQTLGSFFHL